MKNASIITGFAGLALAAGTASAATINIQGRLSNVETPTTGLGLEWGDNSGLANSATIPSPVTDNDGTVTLTVATNGQLWNTGNSAGTYQAGEEWNIRQGNGTILPVSTTAAAAFTNGSYLSISLASAGAFDWTSLSANLWRNGSQSPNNFQFAYSTDASWTTADLIGTLQTQASGTSGTGNVVTVSAGALDLPSGVTSAEARLYYWDTTGTTNLGGNFHLYDVSANYTAVPEPSSTALLGLGGLALIFRRRK
ncbi:MAG: PEP-CTERM sorting domain-containing protein [Akkermansiaceae bacterium]|nr:PEP-CTERM sorting domain-containing protein [Akkermansiaceae bacterium]